MSDPLPVENGEMSLLFDDCDLFAGDIDGISNDLITSMDGSVDPPGTDEQQEELGATSSSVPGPRAPSSKIKKKNNAADRKRAWRADKKVEKQLRERESSILYVRVNALSRYITTLRTTLKNAGITPPVMPSTSARGPPEVDGSAASVDDRGDESATVKGTPSDSAGDAAVLLPASKPVFTDAFGQDEAGPLTCTEASGTYLHAVATARDALRLWESGAGNAAGKDTEGDGEIALVAHVSAIREGFSRILLAIRAKRASGARSMSDDIRQMLQVKRLQPAPSAEGWGSFVRGLNLSDIQVARLLECRNSAQAQLRKCLSGRAVDTANLMNALEASSNEMIEEAVNSLVVVDEPGLHESIVISLLSLTESYATEFAIQEKIFCDMCNILRPSQVITVASRTFPRCPNCVAFLNIVHSSCSTKRH